MSSEHSPYEETIKNGQAHFELPPLSFIAATLSLG